MTSSSPVISVSTELRVVPDDTEIGRATMRRVSLRLLPLVFALYVFNYIDRLNTGMAALQMNRDLGLTATAYGFGVSVFFLGYCLFEVPSNILMARVGARRWMARIVFSWGLIASAMAFVRTPAQFYGLRVLLGIAEAGFFPGIVYYLSQWFPVTQRARALSRFIMAIPLSAIVGNPLAGWLMQFDGSLGLRGWRWVFLVEGIPSVLLGAVTFALLTDTPEHARWLPDEQRAWLIARLRCDEEDSAAPHGVSSLRALASPMVWLVSAPYFLWDMAFYGYMFWAPIFVRDTLKVSEVVTGLVTGLFACLGAVAVLVVGASSDRTGERFRYMLAGLTFVVLGYLSAALLPNATARVAGFAIVLVGLMSFTVTFWCLPTMLLGGSAAAAGIALVNSIGNVGGLVSGYMIGRVKDATGDTSSAWLILAVGALGAIAFVLMLRRQTAFASSTRAALPPQYQPAHGFDRA